ncbi:peptidylprolyl isomerase [Flavobacterium luminosum]|uniref:Peptidyl-prolyl cis-trans isomerase n=1 Tax=Flavobacterium luminosum TaxID=2949086 RepID=A0ABT0TK27_9FLAO|nr:peptidylprolyl isomerase [Flavobacterium sp. HXWNR70]MCL9807859.1 peptidylprolyl isomerase [Flavobacterium sp. HXWNR70]
MRQSIIIVALLALGCKNNFNAKWMQEKSPETFQARFETTKGDFEVEFNRDLSPLAVDRVYQQLRHHFYDNVLFYRVVPNFVVQFGSMDSTKTSHTWDQFKVKDEVVKGSNVKGAISYARSGPNTRGNHLFINLKDNTRLDTVSYNKVKGFPAFGKVTKGMEVVEQLYSGYGNETMKVYDSLATKRLEFISRFPQLDAIKKAYIIKK